MLSTAKALKDYRLDSLDGEIGKVKEFYFDDRYWAVRYLVASTGYWLPGRQVLISPHALVAMERNIYDPAIRIDLTKKQIEESPSLDSDRPVSRQFEDSYSSYYGYPAYWSGPCTWGAYPYPVRDREQWRAAPQKGIQWDAHLRSTRAVTGYHIQALDGEIGHVDDFVIDDNTWAIRYLIIKTGNWWAGNKVLVSPEWIENVSWDENLVCVNLSRKSIQESPPCPEESQLTREYELGLFGHYNRKGYWMDELAAK